MQALIAIPFSATISPCPSSTPSSRTPLTSSSRRLPSSASSSFFGKSASNVGGGGGVRVSTTARRRGGMSCKCLFGLGVPELVVIAGVAVLLFGPKQLPEVGRSIGKTVKSFQQAAKEFETELKKEPDSALDSPVENPTTFDEEKEEIKASSTKENAKG